MYQVAKQVQPFSGNLQYVSSCPKQPLPKMAFCEEHCKAAQKQSIPTELHQFLKHQRGSTSSGLNSAQGSDQRGSTSSGPSSAQGSDETAADCQGIHNNSIILHA